jgi:hypothetical protein
MGSGLIASQKPPGRQKAECRRRTTENRKRRTHPYSAFRSLYSDRSKTDLGSSNHRTRKRRRKLRFRIPFSVIRFLIPSSNQAERAISTGKLNALPRLHIRPIDVVVFHGPSGRSGLEAGFPLRCLQRLSIPYIATLHCGWRHNRSTRGTFTPVLSY